MTSSYPSISRNTAGSFIVLPYDPEQAFLSLEASQGMSQAFEETPFHSFLQPFLEKDPLRLAQCVAAQRAFRDWANTLGQQGGAELSWSPSAVYREVSPATGSGYLQARSKAALLQRELTVTLSETSAVPFYLGQYDDRPYLGMPAELLRWFQRMPWYHVAVVQDAAMLAFVSAPVLVAPHPQKPAEGIREIAALLLLVPLPKVPTAAARLSPALQRMLVQAPETVSPALDILTGASLLSLREVKSTGVSGAVEELGAEVATLPLLDVASLSEQLSAAWPEPGNDRKEARRGSKLDWALLDSPKSLLYPEINPLPAKAPEAVPLAQAALHARGGAES